MVVVEPPPDHVLQKLEQQHPDWTIADWEHWWCKYWMKRDPNWGLLPKCEKCDCWRGGNG